MKTKTNANVAPAASAAGKTNKTTSISNTGSTGKGRKHKQAAGKPEMEVTAEGPVTVITEDLVDEQAGQAGAAAVAAADTEADSGVQITDNEGTGKGEATAEALLQVVGTGEIDARELVIDETRNGRRFKHSDAAVQKRAKSFLANGQQQPIRVQRNAAGKLEVIFGFLRARSGAWINEQGLTAEPWLIRYEEVKINPKDLLVVNMVENLDRAELTDVDLLHDFQRLTKDAGMNQRQIADRLDISEGLVSRIMSLEKLNAREQKLVAQGVIKSEQARELAALEPEKRKPLVDKIVAGEKVTTADVKGARAVSKRTETGEETDEQTGRALAAKAIKLPFEFVSNHVADGGDPSPAEVFCGEFVKFAEGKLKARAIIRAVYRGFGEDVPNFVKQIQE